jgi:hypothetical protein
MRAIDSEKIRLNGGGGHQACMQHVHNAVSGNRRYTIPEPLIVKISASFESSKKQTF